jgi:hypothetical protein
MLRRVPANRAGGATGTTCGAGERGAGAGGAVPSGSPSAPSLPSVGGAAAGGSAAGGSGVQEGTIGTPPPGPPLDCDVPILSLRHRQSTKCVCFGLPEGDRRSGAQTDCSAVAFSRSWRDPRRSQNKRVKLSETQRQMHWRRAAAHWPEAGRGRTNAGLRCRKEDWPVLMQEDQTVNGTLVANNDVRPDTSIPAEAWWSVRSRPSSHALSGRGPESLLSARASQLRILRA